MPEPQDRDDVTHHHAGPPSPDLVPPPGISRRQFTARAAGALAALSAAGAVGYEIAGAGETVTVHNPYANLSAPTKTANVRSGPAPGTPGSGIQRFVTRPDLLPPRMVLNSLDPSGAVETRPRFIVLTPMTDVNYDGLQRGPMMLDRRGRLVWFQPNDSSVFDVNVQTYSGKPVLTWWQGDVVDGHGIGSAILADSSYRTIASLHSRPGMPIDIHELNLTSRGTALVSSFEHARADLRALGGASDAPVLTGHALEIDIATGRVLLNWSSLDHVGVQESDESLPSSSSDAYDYFHLNSIAETPDGQLLISGRHTSTVYKVDRRTGKVIWRLGGKRSDFQIDPAAVFSYQHHVRMHGASDMTLFDNANHTGRETRGLRLGIDHARRRVRLEHSYLQPAKFYAEAMGSVQVLPSGRVFVGWGWQRYFSEFSAGGTMRMSAQFDSEMRSYRAFCVDWVGDPPGRPAVVATTNPSGGFMVYASWNGATEIARWVVLAGATPSSLEAVGSQPWSGFETAIAVNSTGPCFVAVAQDGQGRELGRSEIT